MGDLFDKKASFHPNFGPTNCWGGPDTWGGKAHGALTALDPRLDGGVKGGLGSLGNRYDPMNAMHSGLTGSDLYGGLFGLNKSMTGGGSFGGFLGGDYKLGSNFGNFGEGMGWGGGLGYSTWDAKSATGGSYSGGSASLGGVQNMKSAWDIMGFGNDTNLNVYRGVGGSGYSFNEPDRVDKDGKLIAGKSGVGVDGSYTPIGIANSSSKWTAGNYGSLESKIGNAYLDKQSVSGQAGKTTDGTYFADGNYSKRTGLDNASTSLKTGVGSADLSVGHASFGSGYSGGGSYNPQTGSWEVHGAQLAEGLKVQNANLGFNIGDDALKGKVHMGQWDTTGNNNLQAGWDAKRGVFAAKGEYGWGGGGTLTDTNFDIASKDKSVYANGGLGKLVTGGYSAKGGIEYDSKTGMLTGQGSGRGGGVQLEDAKLAYGVKGLGSVDASLGKFSNDTIVEDLKFSHGNGKTGMSLGNLDGMGMRFDNAKFESKNDLLGINTKAGFESLASTNSIQGATLDADYSSWENASLKGGFKNLAWGGWSGKNLDAAIDGPLGINAKAHMGSFNQGFTGEGGRFELSSKKGLDIGLDKGRYDVFTMSDVDLQGGIGDLYKAKAHLGEGSYNHFAAENVNAGFNLDKGLYAGLEKGNYSYLAAKDFSSESSMFGGAIKQSAKLGEGSLGGVDIGKLQYNSTLRNTNLTATDVGAHGLKMKDVALDGSVGKAGYSVGAKQLNALDLSVGKIDAHTKNFGLGGNASIEKANLDALNIKDGHAGLSWGGKEFLGASGSLRTGAGVDKANLNYDLLAGKADGSFKNANIGGQLNDAKINLFGTDIAIPDMGGKLNASGGGAVDLTRGAANGNLSLAGSSVNFAGHELTLGDWAQASAGVDLSQGAANFNLGGRNGVGADMNLAEGNLDLNLFGHTIDVDQGIRDVGSAIGTGARAVGGAIADGASAAWDFVTSW